MDNLAKKTVSRKTWSYYYDLLWEYYTDLKVEGHLSEDAMQDYIDSFCDSSFEDLIASCNKLGLTNIPLLYLV